MSPHRPPGLLGRAAERQALDRLLDDVRAHRSAVLIVRGEAGVGKTALLQYCARQAAGFRVARGHRRRVRDGAAVRGAPSAVRADARSARRPSGSRSGRRSRVALGLDSGAAPDRFLVALAALSLLAEVAAERPLLCLVDDAQWLDAASAQVLGFVARRLLAESVAIVFAVRDPAEHARAGGPAGAGARGAADEDAHALLATVIPGRLDERVRGRLVAETRGNPLAILELPRGADGDAAARRARPPTRARAAGTDRGELPAAARGAARRGAAAAARRRGGADRRSRCWCGARPSGSASSQLDRRRDEGLLTIGERVAFLHPLVRSAVYRSASPQERRAVHLALAEVTDADAGADRRAWHLRGGRAGPDEDVAAELERSAGRAQARGGLAAAAAFLRRSVALTRDPARRVDRALAAAQACLHAGRFDAALELLAAAEAGDARRARARPRRAAARRGRLRPGPRQRGAAAAAARRADARAARRAARARHLPRRLGRGAVRRAPGAARANLRGRLRGRS